MKSPKDSFSMQIQWIKLDMSTNVRIKYPKKFLMWQALESCGNVSEPFISEGSMGRNVYLNKFVIHIMKSLVFKYFLWSDTDHLKAKSIDLITREDKAPNFPQGRLIKWLWAICKLFKASMDTKRIDCIQTDLEENQPESSQNPWKIADGSTKDYAFGQERSQARNGWRRFSNKSFCKTLKIFMCC